jgi:hypothetical protein
MLELKQGADNRLGPVPVAPTLGGTAQPVAAAAHGHWSRHQRIQLAPELKLQEPVEIVHLY